MNKEKLEILWFLKWSQNNHIYTKGEHSELQGGDGDFLLESTKNLIVKFFIYVKNIIN